MSNLRYLDGTPIDDRPVRELSFANGKLQHEKFSCEPMTKKGTSKAVSLAEASLPETEKK